jgi:hypothetical protein
MSNPNVKIGSLAILGAGGHGRSVADTAEGCGWQVDLYDDAWPELQASGPWRVVGNYQTLGPRSPMARMPVWSPSVIVGAACRHTVGCMHWACPCPP